MEEEALDSRILLELLNTVRLINRRVSYPESLEGTTENFEEVSELGIDDGFRTGICFSEPDEMSSQSVDLGCK